MVKDDEFARMYRRAVRSAREFDRKHPPAVAASCDPSDRTVRVDFPNGCAFLFPADMAQGLRDASDEQLAAVELMRPATDCTGRSWTRISGSPP